MKSKHLPLIVLFILIIPAFWFLLKPGIYWNMHDDMQLVRQMELEKCIKDGQIPCRWVPDLGYGYGYPLFNFYPPLPYILGLPFRLLDFSFVTTIKLTAAFQFIAAAYAIYFLASSMFGPLGGIISSLFYTYAPYHAVNIYVRGAMNEAWASVFFPLIFYFSKKYIEKKHKSSLLFLSISFACLMLSHNPMVLVFSPIVLLWSLFWVYQQQIKERLTLIYNLSLSAVLAFLLSAFFTLPVIFESKLVQIESMFSNYYHYSIHFVSLKQLFISNYWGDGPSVWGINDGMSFSVGYLHWIIPLLIIIYLFTRFLKHKKTSSIEISLIFLILTGLFLSFMTHERSTFIWQLIPQIQKIQFPWRFLNLVAFFFSLSVGYAGTIFLKFTPKLRYSFFIFLVIVLFILNLSHFTPITSGPITDAQKFSGIAWTNQITGGIYDYLPKTASTAPKSPASDYVDMTIPPDVTYNLSGQKKGSDWMFFNIKLTQPAKIYLPLLAFPEFKLYVDNKRQNYQIEPTLGRISIDLDSSQHQVYIKLSNTPIRIFGNFLSLTALIFTLFSFFNLHERSRNRHT